MLRTLAILATLYLSHRHLLGQAPPPVTDGQTVRITSHQPDLRAEIGRVLSATADTIVIQVTGIRTVNYRQIYGTDTLALPVAAIDRLEVSRHSGHRTGRGALIGLGAGAATGFVIGVLTYRPCHPTGFLDCLMAPESAGEQGIMGAAVLGVLGAGVGALVGSMIRVDKWEETPLHAAMSVRALPKNRLGLLLTAAF